MNAYEFKVTDPYVGKTETVLVFAADAGQAEKKLRQASSEVNGAGLDLRYELRQVTELQTAGAN